MLTLKLWIITTLKIQFLSSVYQSIHFIYLFSHSFVRLFIYSFLHFVFLILVQTIFFILKASTSLLVRVKENRTKIGVPSSCWTLDSLSCTKDKLQISDNTGASYVLCGKLSPVPMMLYGNEVKLTFVTDGLGSGGKFLFRYNLTSLPQQGLPCFSCLFIDSFLKNTN